MPEQTDSGAARQTLALGYLTIMAGAARHGARSVGRGELHLLDDLEQSLQRGRARRRLPARAFPVGFQGERTLVAILQHGANVSEVIELASAHGRPFHLLAIVTIVA